MDEREYFRQTAKLSNGNRKALSTPWEEAGQMDPLSYQVSAAATAALMSTFMSLERLRRMMEHSVHVLDEFHVGELDPPAAAEYCTTTTTSAAAVPTHGGSAPQVGPLHGLWRDQVAALYLQSSEAVQNIKAGLEEMLNRYTSSLRTVDPILVLRGARDRVATELGRELQEKCGANCGMAIDAAKQSCIVPAPPAPRVSATAVRPWSSGSLTERVASAISRSGTTPSTAHLLMSAPTRPQTAAHPRSGEPASAEVSPRQAHTSASPRQHKEHTRVQVIKRTAKEAKELLIKFDVATVVPCTAMVTREALANPTTPRAATTAADRGAEGSTAHGAAAHPPHRVLTPRRVAVPPIEATAATGDKVLPHTPQTVEEKAGAILYLKANRTLYRTLKVDERQVVLEHERREQLYHHHHAVINMKIVGAEFNLKKAKSAAANGNTPNPLPPSSSTTAVDSAAAPSQGSDLPSVKEAEDHLTELQRQKRYLEEERARDVRLACVSLARQKRHLPEVY